jgi:predicted RNA-binding Zn-ribbon protein involved in translation (DUF1610 family)
MTTIRTTCPKCGEVDMGPESILLSVMAGGREGTYRFTCPMCTDAVEKRADRKIVALLVSAGVDVAGESGLEESQTEFEDMAPMFDDANEDLPEGPAFTTDDLIEFHFLLEDERYIQDFLTTR